MATKIKRLSTRRVDTVGPGFHADGGGLYLRVRDTGCRSWVFRYTRAGKVREIGLGATHTRSLADGRRWAEAMRQAIADGEDPAALIRTKKEECNAPITFESCALALIESKRAGWRNAKHAQQWLNTLGAYAFPLIGKKNPADVTLADIKVILLPLWSTKTETASRLRQRIEAVLDAPTALINILNTTLANNGGPARTHALVGGSPAIDTVTDGTCPPPRRDQRGVRRPQDGDNDGAAICDTGSFERR
ncbi:MAG TPA: Arm DNA-binding domain-containing protein [Gammaproteobacteria bacterium]|nr:Arm DNA-binding domain-containing protein [Gammaproteobacteria bacterium]